MEKLWTMIYEMVVIIGVASNPHVSCLPFCSTPIVE